MTILGKRSKTVCPTVSCLRSQNNKTKVKNSKEKSCFPFAIQKALKERCFFVCVFACLVVVVLVVGVGFFLSHTFICLEKWELQPSNNSEQHYTLLKIRIQFGIPCPFWGWYWWYSDALKCCPFVNLGSEAGDNVI